VWVAVDESKPGEKLYTCVMHPEVISKKPGDCPKCGMKLVPKKTSGKLTAHLIEVETGVSSGDRVRILNGLAEGDDVIVDGIENVTDGSVLFATDWGPGGPKAMPPPPAMESDPSGHDMGAMKKNAPAAAADGMSGMDMPPAAKKPVKKKESSDTYYTCPMHPEVHSDKSGKCPKCGMDLVKKKAQRK
jgi:hypothetical protein